MVSYLQSKPSLFVTCFGPELSWEDHFPKLINSYLSTVARVRVLKTCRALIALLPNLLGDSECFPKLSRLSFSGKCPTNPR